VVELASLCWKRGCLHFLHLTSSVVNGASNSPRKQGHRTSSSPIAPTAVQRPDAIVREIDGAGCSVLFFVAGFWRNGRSEKKEEAILRKYKIIILSLGSRGRDFSRFSRLEGANNREPWIWVGQAINSGLVEFSLLRNMLATNSEQLVGSQKLV
jgi:hypothetical protein